MSDPGDEMFDAEGYPPEAILKGIRDMIRVEIPDHGLCKGKMVLWGGGVGHEIALCIAGNSYQEAVLNSLWGLLKE